MKQYQENEHGEFYNELIGTIPPDLGNSDYQRMLAEIADGTGEIIPHVPYAPTIADQLAATDASLPRIIEDVLDAVIALGGVVAQPTVDKLAAKKALRGQL